MNNLNKKVNIKEITVLNKEWLLSKDWLFFIPAIVYLLLILNLPN